MNFEEEKLQREIQKARQLIGKSKCNILITGITGVGKSTLINAVFKDKLAKTGVGEPVTKDIKPYEIPANNFRIYDTPGIERKDIKKIKQKVFKKIKEQRKRKLEEHIHCIWYCINEGTGRLEEEEKKWIEELIEKEIKMIIVLTKQAYNDEFFHYLKKQKLPKIIRVGTEPMQVVEKISQQVHTPKLDTPGLESLVKTTTELIPEIARQSFINALLDIDLKKKVAYISLFLYAGSGFVIAGFIPIPLLGKKLSDVAVQTLMLVHFLYLFELELKNEQIPELLFVGTDLTLITLSMDEVLEKIAEYTFEDIAQEIIAGGSISLSMLVIGFAYIEVLTEYKKAQLKGVEISFSQLKEMLSQKIEEYKALDFQTWIEILNGGGQSLVPQEI
ncbi:MAG: GTPase domain-containing protein [Okeania sp. SIO3B5]|uniref:GTPase n=1 Tax=Okeania sp. SIO3B5 TaxID=2607811 RepID=UPI0014001968|nr:GTPase domain-containing protein [Okeania sp. SIO3B5]NEO56473.1 GTPase domain-containing protein [Okeania sp. SIO3B5]